MALIPAPVPVIKAAPFLASAGGDSANNPRGESVRSFEDPSQNLSSATRDEVGTAPEVQLAPPAPIEIVEEDEDGDNAEPEVDNKFKGTCLASPYIPYIPSEVEGIPTSNGAGAAMVLQEDRLWVNGETITYAFMPPASKRHEWGEEKVHDIVKEWSLYANITFKHIQDVEQAFVRITFNRSDGSWTLTGSKLIKDHPTDQPTMNLGGVENTSKTQESDVGTILHEFGHVLGLKHEHQSPLRGDVLRINEQFTIDAFKKCRDWSAEDVKEQILNVYNSDNLGNYTDLDLSSIMMYFMPAAQNDKGLEIKPNNKLSDYDKASMLIHYPYFGFEPKVEGWGFAKALDVFGIQGADRKKMMQLYGAGNVRDVRRHFAKVCESAREQRNTALARDVAAGPRE